MNNDLNFALLYEVNLDNILDIYGFILIFILFAAPIPNTSQYIPQKFSHFCSMEERNSFRFETIRVSKWWQNSDYSFDKPQTLIQIPHTGLDSFWES